MDSFWLEVEETKLSTGKSRFKHLPEMALAALSLPCSKADPERLFSMTRKVHTD